MNKRDKLNSSGNNLKHAIDTNKYFEGNYIKCEYKYYWVNFLDTGGLLQICTYSDSLFSESIYLEIMYTLCNAFLLEKKLNQKHRKRDLKKWSLWMIKYLLLHVWQWVLSLCHKLDVKNYVTFLYIQVVTIKISFFLYSISLQEYR